MADAASSDEKNNAQNRSREQRLSVPRQASKRQTVPVTVENFQRAESDMYFAEIALKDGGFGKFNHRREPMKIDAQAVIRANRDTLYSAAVFDLDAGPTTIILPDAGDRFISLQIVDEDHYTPAVFYDPGSYTFSKERIGTRYMLAAVRILVNPNDSDDIRDVHTLQDGIQGWQKSHGRFEVPEWDPKAKKEYEMPCWFWEAPFLTRIAPSAHAIRSIPFDTSSGLPWDGAAIRKMTHFI